MFSREDDTSQVQPQKELPRIVEETTGETFALSPAWVLFNGMKFVAAYYLDDNGNALVGDDEVMWGTIEMTGPDGTVTYNDNVESRLPGFYEEIIWERFDDILKGKAECGPMFKDDLPRVVSQDDGHYALTPAWATYQGERFVLLQYIEENGDLADNDEDDSPYLVAREETNDGVTTYDDDPEYHGRVEERLHAILRGEAESGPLE